MKLMNFRISPELKQELEEYCKSADKSKSFVIREAIWSKIKKSE